MSDADPRHIGERSGTGTRPLRSIEYGWQRGTGGERRAELPARVVRHAVLPPTRSHSQGVWRKKLQEGFVSTVPPRDVAPQDSRTISSQLRKISRVGRCVRATRSTLPARAG